MSRVVRSWGKSKGALAQALDEQLDPRFSQSPLFTALTRAFGLDELASGEGFERRELVEVAAALQRSLPHCSSDLLIEACQVIHEARARGTYLAPRQGFWAICQRVQELRQDQNETALLDEWRQMNRKELNGSSESGS